MTPTPTYNSERLLQALREKGWDGKNLMKAIAREFDELPDQSLVYAWLRRGVNPTKYLPMIARVTDKPLEYFYC